jgi:response regulator NasT
MPPKILLAVADAERARALEEQLADAGFAQVLRAPGGLGLAQAAGRIEPDLIVLDMALPDRGALEDLRAASAAYPVVVFADSDDPAFAQEAIAAGVCSYNPSGAALQDVKPIAAAAIALFQRTRKMEVELTAARQQLDERRLVERAKAILMRGRRMTEPEAHRWLQRRAMNENRKILQVAAALVLEQEQER